MVISKILKYIIFVLLQPDVTFVTKMQPMKVSGGLFTAKLRLHFTLKRHHFIQGHVKVKCTSSIYTEYFQSNSLSLPGIGLGEKALGISGRSSGKKRYYL